MEWILLAFVAFVGFAIVSNVIARKRDPLGPVTIDQLPADARGWLERVVPDFHPQQIEMTQSGRYVRLRGERLGELARAKFEYTSDGTLDEFEFEVGSGRSARGRGVKQEDLPAAVTAEFDRVLGDARAEYDVRALFGGTYSSEGKPESPYYKTKGAAAGMIWEIEVDGDGRLIEVEIERQRAR